MTWETPWVDRSITEGEKDEDAEDVDMSWESGEVD